MTIILEILINVVILMTYTKKVEFSYTTDKILDLGFIESLGLGTPDLIQILGLAHFIFSILKAVTFLIVNVRLIVSKNW